MYIPVISEISSIIVLISKVAFCVLAAVKVIWNEEDCYETIKNGLRCIIICSDEDAENLTKPVKTLEIIGLVSWVVWLCQFKM